MYAILHIHTFFSTGICAALHERNEWQQSYQGQGAGEMIL